MPRCRAMPTAPSSPFSERAKAAGGTSGISVRTAWRRFWRTRSSKTRSTRGSNRCHWLADFLSFLSRPSQVASRFAWRSGTRKRVRDLSRIFGYRLKALFSEWFVPFLKLSLQFREVEAGDATELVLGVFLVRLPSAPQRFLQPPDPHRHLEADAAHRFAQGRHRDEQPDECRVILGFTVADGFRGRADLGRRPVDLQRQIEPLLESVANSPQPHRVAVFLLGQFLEQLVGDLPRLVGDEIAPAGGEFVLAATAEHFMRQGEWPHPPRHPVVFHLQTQEIEQDVDVLAVIRLRGRGVVVAVFVVMFDESLEHEFGGADGANAVDGAV